MKNVVLVALMGACLSARAQGVDAAVQYLETSCAAYAAGKEGGDFCVGAIAAAREGLIAESQAGRQPLGVCSAGGLPKTRTIAEATVTFARLRPGETRGVYETIKQAMRAAFPCR